MRAKFEVCSFSLLELLAFNTQKFTESRDSGHSPFRKIFQGYVTTVPGRIFAPKMQRYDVLFLKCINVCICIFASFVWISVLFVFK